MSDTRVNGKTASASDKIELSVNKSSNLKSSPLDCAINRSAALEFDRGDGDRDRDNDPSDADDEREGTDELETERAVERLRLVRTLSLAVRCRLFANQIEICLQLSPVAAARRFFSVAVIVGVVSNANTKSFRAFSAI